MANFIAILLCTAVTYSVVSALVAFSGFWLTAGVVWVCIMFSAIYINSAK